MHGIKKNLAITYGRNMEVPQMAVIKRTLVSINLDIVGFRELASGSFCRSRNTFFNSAQSKHDLCALSGFLSEMNIILTYLFSKITKI